MQQGAQLGTPYDMQTIKNMILDAQRSYFCEGGNMKFTDREFDAMVRYYQDVTGEVLNLNGYVTQDSGQRAQDRITELPVPMPSLDKIKGKDANKELKKFIDRCIKYAYDNNCYNGIIELVIADKINGISLLLVYDNYTLKIYGKGNGDEAQDISFISNHIMFPRLQYGVIRGEIVIHEDKFKEIQKVQNYTTALAALSGIINKKGQNNSTLLNNATFYAFSIVNYTTNFDDLPYIKQYTAYQQMKEQNFNVPINISTYQINAAQITDEYINTIIKDLEGIITDNISKAPYDMDGIVLTINQPLRYPIVNDNPELSIAFKKDTEFVVQVINMYWKPTKYGYLQPQILITPTIMFGTLVKEISGKNAKFLVDNNIGIGSLIIATKNGNIIPGIIRCIIPSDNRPGPPYECEWNDTRVELVMKNKDDKQVYILKLTSFLKAIGVKGCGEDTVAKLYEYGITTFDHYIMLKPQMIWNIPTMGEVSANNLCREISRALHEVTYLKLMYATGIFGEAIGFERLSKFINHYPNWQTREFTAQDIQMVPDIGSVLSVQFAENLPKFKQWLNERPMFQYLGTKIKGNHSTELAGQTIVFSGFRDDSVKILLESKGAKVKYNWINACTLLVVKSKTDSCNKMTEARNRGVQIVDKTEFSQMLKTLKIV